MASHLIRFSRLVPQLGTRTLATSSALQSEALPAAVRDKFYPKIGNREVVGSGFNGVPSYMDRGDYPFPAIRFKEDSGDVQALKQKEQGDWKNLTLDEKKALYRASFCQTFAEMNASSGEWKALVAGILTIMTVTGWFLIFVKKFVYPPMPHTITSEWQDKQAQIMIKQRQGPIEGLASQYDYEKNDWK